MSIDKKIKDIQRKHTCLLCGNIIIPSKLDKFNENFEVLVEAVKDGKLDTDKKMCDTNEGN